MEDKFDDLKDVLLDCETLQSNTQQQKFSIVKELGIDRNETTEISTLLTEDDDGGAGTGSGSGFGGSRNRNR